MVMVHLMLVTLRVHNRYPAKCIILCFLEKNDKIKMSPALSAQWVFRNKTVLFFIDVLNNKTIFILLNLAGYPLILANLPYNLVGLESDHILLDFAG